MADTVKPGGTMGPQPNPKKAKTWSGECLIVALDGLHPLAAPSRHWLVDTNEITLRRHPGATKDDPGGGQRSHDRSTPGALRLRLPDVMVSAKHALVRREGRRWSVVDEGSTNGTWINGERLERHQGRRMIDGDILRLGRTCLVFREAELGERPRQVDVTADELASQASPRGLRTMSPALEREFALAAKIARSTAPVAILGETGTGKELTALAIHELSQRRGRFVAVNCAGIPEQLVASEMFGHRKGAHSLALTDRDGLVRESDKGTLFLDEIGDLPLPIQATLLRTLQDGTVRPLGSTRDEKVDLRVVCATHVDVPGLIVRARFREDLWGRLAGHVLRLPALRHRREDLGLLMRDILTRSATAAAPTLSVEAIDVITSHAWPRNIRQLEHALKRALTLANGEITIDDLPDDVSVATEDERDRLVDLLRIHRGNLPAVAAAEGVTRQAIEKRCKKHGVDYKAFRDGTAPAAALPEDAARADEP